MFVDPLTFFQKLWKTMYIIPYDNQCQFYYNLRSVEDKFFKPIIGANAMKNKNILCLKTNVKKIIQKYTGRNVKKYRIDNHPVKTIAKALINNDLQLCIKNLASDELYNKLYPMMDNN